MRTCAKCLQEKPVEDFKSSYSYCVPCYNEYKREWRAKNRDKVQASNARYHYRTRYDSSPEEKLEQLNKQNGKCALCGDSVTLLKSHWDHNHTTGKLREVLCSSCNMGLGLFKDDPDRLLLAIAYLARHAD